MADVSVTAANLRIGNNAKIYRNQPAGATITRGQVVYKDTTASNVWKLADVNASSLAAGNGTDIGIALQDVASGQYFDVVYEDDDFTPGFTVTANTIYVASATAGGIAPAADVVSGWYLTILGPGKTAAKMNLKIIKSGAAS